MKSKRACGVVASVWTMVGNFSVRLVRPSPTVFVGVRVSMVGKMMRFASRSLMGVTMPQVGGREVRLEFGEVYPRGRPAAAVCQ